MTIFWPLSRQFVLDRNGRPILDVQAEFFDAGTTTPRVVYANAARTVALSQPVQSDSTGRFPRVYLPDGLYAERVFSGAGQIWRDDGLGEPLPTVDPVDPTPEPTAASYFVTGDVKWRLDGGILPGWVRMNGRTIGNAGSGASERGHADTLAAFVYLWQTFGNDLASVVGGRGSSAEGDFAAGKQIAIPSMQGVVAGGLDSMGATAAERIQTIATLTLTAGSATARVDSASRITIGMLIFADGVSTGTSVLDIENSTITMSAPASAGSTGDVQGRFSIIDANRAGALGGTSLRSVSNKNLPVNLPGGSTSYDPPPVPGVRYKTLQSLRIGDGGTAITVPNIWQDVEPTNNDPGGPTPLTVAIDNPNAGRPIVTMQPTRLGTFYLKL